MGGDANLGLSLRGWGVDADICDVFSVVSDEHTIVFYSGYGELEMYIYSRESAVMPYDEWSMPDPGYWFWEGLLRALLLRDMSALTSDGGLAFHLPDMRMHVLAVDHGLRRRSDELELHVAVEALHDRRTRWVMQTDGFLAEDRDGMPCLRRGEHTVMKFGIPGYALKEIKEGYSDSFVYIYELPESVTLSDITMEIEYHTFGTEPKMERDTSL